MFIRAVIFGIVGALFFSGAGAGQLPLLFGLLVGIAFSELLRMHADVQQLRARLDALEKLDTPRDLKQTATPASQPTASVAPQPQAPPAAESAPDSSEPVAAPPRPVLAETVAAIVSGMPSPLVAAAGDAEAGTGSAGELKRELKAAPAAPRAPRLTTPKPVQALLDRMSTTTRIGIVVLFFGVSFLLKYAADRGFFPIEVRLLCVVALGLVIYLIGRRLQPRERVYGLLLRGAGIGIWYLCSYAAFSLYHMVGANLTFAILVALSGFTAWNAVAHNTRAMAIFAIIGGFLAPILMSTGEGNHIALFIYYSVVNAGIVAIAYRQTWHELPTIGFLFTFAIGALWGATAYRPEFFGSTEPFLLLSAAFYLAVPILFAFQVPRGGQPLYRNILVFGTPAIAFTLQLRLVSDFDNGDVWSAIGFGAAYVAVLAITWKKLGEYALALRDALVGITVVFFTLAVAFALDQQVAGAIWAVEAAGGVWLALRQQRRWGCYLALLILVGSGVLWLADPPSAGDRLFLNPAFLQVALIALSGLVIAFLLDRARALVAPAFGMLAAGWAAIWWLAGGAWQLDTHLPDDAILNAMGLYVLCSSAALVLLQQARRLELAGFMAQYSMHLLGALGIGAALQAAGPLSGLGAVTWPLAVLFMYAALYMLSARPALDTATRTNYFVATALVLALAIAEFTPYLTDRYPATATWLIGVMLPLLCVFQILQRLRFWRSGFDALHTHWISGLVMALIVVCFLVGLFVPPAIETRGGDVVTWPLSFLQVLALISGAAWWADQSSKPPLVAFRSRGWLLIGLCTFALANVILLRILHVQQGIAFTPAELAANDTVQTTLSVFWTLVGVVTVMWSSRRQHSALWHMGMGLLAIVVAKLFLVDLAQSGTVERIVSFIAVGLLLMLVGWKSPRPQRAQTFASSAAP